VKDLLGGLTVVLGFGCLDPLNDFCGVVSLEELPVAVPGLEVLVSDVDDPAKPGVDSPAKPGVADPAIPGVDDSPETLISSAKPPVVPDGSPKIMPPSSAAYSSGKPSSSSQLVFGPTVSPSSD
jgi:hypothetical protein